MLVSLSLPLPLVHRSFIFRPRSTLKCVGLCHWVFKTLQVYIYDSRGTDGVQHQQRAMSAYDAEQGTSCHTANMCLHGVFSLYVYVAFNVCQQIRQAISPHHPQRYVFGRACADYAAVVSRFAQPINHMLRRPRPLPLVVSAPPVVYTFRCVQFRRDLSRNELATVSCNMLEGMDALRDL